MPLDDVALYEEKGGLLSKRVNIVSTKDYYIEIAKGNVQGSSIIHVSGLNTAVTFLEDIWIPGAFYTFLTDVATSLELLSDNAADNGTGAGAQSVLVEGLDANYDEISETVIPTGITPVSLVNSYKRINFAKVTGPNASDGSITIRVAGGGATVAFLAFFRNQTNQAIYTIPNGKTGYLLRYWIDMDLVGNLTGSLYMGEPGTDVFRSVDSFHVDLSNINRKFDLPLVFPAKSYARFTCSSGGSAANVSGGFEMLLVDN